MVISWMLGTVSASLVNDFIISLIVLGAVLGFTWFGLVSVVGVLSIESFAKVFNIYNVLGVGECF